MCVPYREVVASRSESPANDSITSADEQRGITEPLSLHSRSLVFINFFLLDPRFLMKTLHCSCFLSPCGFYLPSLVLSLSLLLSLSSIPFIVSLFFPPAVLFMLLLHEWISLLPLKKATCICVCVCVSGCVCGCVCVEMSSNRMGGTRGTYGKS